MLQPPWTVVHSYAFLVIDPGHSCIASMESRLMYITSCFNGTYSTYSMVIITTVYIEDFSLLCLLQMGDERRPMNSLECTGR